MDKKIKIILIAVFVSMFFLLNYCAYQQGKKNEIIKAKNEIIFQEIEKNKKTENLNKEAKNIYQLIQGLKKNEICRFVIEFNLNQCVQ